MSISLLKRYKNEVRHVLKHVYIDTEYILKYSYASIHFNNILGGTGKRDFNFYVFCDIKDVNKNEIIKLVKPKEFNNKVYLGIDVKELIPYFSVRNAKGICSDILDGYSLEAFYKYVYYYVDDMEFKKCKAEDSFVSDIIDLQKYLPIKSVSDRETFIKSDVIDLWKKGIIRDNIIFKEIKKDIKGKLEKADITTLDGTDFGKNKSAHDLAFIKKENFVSICDLDFIKNTYYVYNLMKKPHNMEDDWLSSISGVYISFPTLHLEIEA